MGVIDEHVRDDMQPGDSGTAADARAVAKKANAIGDLVSTGRLSPYELNSTFGFDRTVVLSSRYGAIAQDTTSPAVRAANTTAFANATADALALGDGATLRIPPGVYPIDKWVVDAPGIRHITIDCTGGVTLLIPSDLATGVAAGDPAVTIGSSTLAADGAGFARFLSIVGTLHVVADLDRSSGTYVNRRGILLKGIQDFECEQLWAGGFSGEGLYLDTVYDSALSNVTVYRSAMGSSHAVLVTSTIGDNTNATKFHGLRVESCPRLLRIDMPSGFTGASQGPRQIDFFGAKFEQRVTNWSGQAPILIGHSKGIRFFGGSMVRQLESISGVTTQPMLYATPRRTTDTTASQQPSVQLFGVSFNSPNGSASWWLGGDRWGAQGCEFQKTTNIDSSQPAFALGDDCYFVNNTISFASAGDVTGASGVTVRNDAFLFSGSRSVVRDNHLYFPGDGSGPSGNLVTLAASVPSDAQNVFEQRTTGFGYPNGQISIADGNNNLDGRLLVTPASFSLGGTLPVGTPSVFNRIGGTLLAGTYTEFRGASTGQTITLVAGAGQTAVLQHSDSGIRLHARANLTLTEYQSVTLRRIGGAWIEV